MTVIVRMHTVEQKIVDGLAILSPKHPECLVDINQGNAFGKIGKDVLSALVLYIFISNPPIFAASTELGGHDGFATLADLLNSMARIGFPILLVFTVIGIVKKVFDLLKAETVKN